MIINGETMTAESLLSLIKRKRARFKKEDMQIIDCSITSMIQDDQECTLIINTNDYMILQTFTIGEILSMIRTTIESCNIVNGHSVIDITTKTFSNCEIMNIEKFGDPRSHMCTITVSYDTVSEVNQLKPL